MTEIKYIEGDATSPIGEGLKIIPHVCNSVGAWGSGFVLAVSKKWKQPEVAYRMWSKDKETFKLGETQIVPVGDGIVVANMIGQVMGYIDGLPPVRYEAIREALKKVKNYCIENSASMHAPMFGASLSGGSWEVIEKIIQEEICSYDIPVTIYKFVDKNAISYIPR